MSAQPYLPYGSEEARRVAERDSALPYAIQESSGLGTYAELWQAIQHSIRERLGLKRYSLWFRKTELLQVQDDRLVVGVPNVIIQQYLTASYGDAVCAAAGELVGRDLAVSFDVAPRLFRQMRADQQAELDRGDQIAEEHVLLRPEPVRSVHAGFDQLIVTRANRLPFAAARELAGQETPRFQLLYVCGDFGLGKSALLRAMHALGTGTGSRLKCICESAEDWCNDYYHAIQSRTTRSFRSRYRSCDLLLLDDVQFVQGKAAGQTELLHTVKHLLDHGKRVALSARPHVEKLEEVAPELRALLRRAFPAVMKPPDADERDSVARELAARRGLKATDEAFELLSRGHCGSFAAAEAAINCLVLHAGVNGCGKVDLAAGLEALAAVRAEPVQRLGMPAIAEAVAGAYSIPVEQLRGRSRARTVCQARHVAVYLSRGLTGASLSEIGRFFGGVTHSTVKHAVDKIASALDTDSRLAGLITTLEEQLRGRR